MAPKLFYSWKKNVLYLNVNIKPDSRRNSLIGIFNSQLKISIAAKPREEKANTELITFLANFFKVTKHDITIVKGRRSNDKVLSIAGLSSPEKELETIFKEFFDRR